MSATFVLGRSGSGKTAFVQNRIKAILESGGSAIVIVPEQFTYETERQLSEKLGGLMNAGVFSFTTLAEKALGGRIKGFLSRQGRRMVVRKVITERGAGLSAFGRVKDRAGFSTSCDELFTMWKRFEISPEELERGAEQLPEGGLLRAKLLDLAMLYGGTEEYLRGRYMDTEDMLAALKEELPRSFVNGADVLIDGFDMLTTQLYAIMEAIMETANSVTITFRADPLPCRDSRVFAPELKAYGRLYDKAREMGMETRTVRLTGSTRAWAPALAHLEKEAFSYPFNKYEGEDVPIRLYAGASPTEECEAAAEAVLEAARGGLRYRDMAAIAGEPGYIPCLVRAFRKRGIPFFTDGAKRLSSYPGARLVLSALGCIRGYTLQGLMELIRTGLAGVSMEEGDEFENYALMRGVKHTGFAKPFDDPGAEAVRQRIMPGLMALRDGLAQAGTAGGKAEAVFKYMEDAGLYSKTMELAEELRAAGELELAEEHSQVYRLMLTVLDQLHAIMGDGSISTPRFAAVLEEGFDAYEISAIPATADQVLIGSVGKTRSRPLAALFILGANEGSFPHYRNDDSVISDRDIQELTSRGMKGWDSAQDRADVELMDVYCALSKAEKGIYISYCLSSGSDSAAPAAVVDRIEDIFDIKPLTGFDTLPPQSPEGGLELLARELRSMGDECREPKGLAPLYAYFAGKPSYKGAVAAIEDALYYRCSPEPFGHELSLKLYGDSLFGSATRLEQFNACPFRHFVLHGLRAGERKEYRERRLDQGSFCHEALEAFVKRIMERDIKALTDKDCDAIADEILPELIARHNGGVLMSSARSLALCARLVRSVKATARAIVRQINAGAFRPERTEAVFGPGGMPPLVLELPTGEKFYIGGRIDRIDRGNVEGRDCCRVVDYKTGGASFDYARLYHGLSLQLPLYAAAIAAAGSFGEVAGMYYMKAADPVTKESDDSLEKRVMQAFRLSGLTLSDPEIVRATAGDGGDNSPISTSGRSKGFVSREELNEIIRYAGKKSGDTLEKIYEGRAEASPASLRGWVPCDGCESRSVCGFDKKLPGCSERRVDPLDREEFFRAAEGREKGDGMDS